MKHLESFTRFTENQLSRIRIFLSLIVLLFFFSVKMNAQSGTLTFSGSGTTNLGTMLYDNQTYSTDISNIQIKVFNASSDANAASRTSIGSLVLVTTPDINSTYPAIFSNNSTSGTLVFDDSNKPKYIVLASTSGAEFRFSSVYIVEPSSDWINPPHIKFEGYKDGILTGSVILVIDQASGEYQKTFDASYFPVSIFGNVDEVRISRGYDDGIIGNLDGFNNFVFGAPVTSYVTVSTNSLEIGATEGSTTSFNITSNTSWTVSSNQTWLTPSPTSGSNNSSVTLTAQANPSTTSSRTATVTVGTNMITVTQPASTATLSVSSTSLNITATANSTATFDISSNVSWTVSSDQTWLFVSPTSGSNNGTVTLTAQANPNAATRSATITVSGSGTPQTITVTQAAASPTLSVSSNSVSMANSENSTANFQVISNTTWSISSGQAWVSASPSSSTGSAWITLTATSDNTNTTPRTATITVSASGVSSQTITVEQDGTSTIFSVSPTSINVGSSSGSTSFTITSNISWTTLIDQTWVSISPTSGSSTSTVTVNYDANTTTSERTSTITINGENGDKKYVQIIQSGVAKTLSVSAVTLDIAKTTNSTASFDITSNTSWSIASDQSWISASPTGGMNNASITLTTSEDNPYGFSRTATITVSADGLSDKTITVTQEASTAILSVSNSTLDISGAANSTVTFDITSNINWTLESSQSWLTPSDLSGLGNKTITLTAEENPLTIARTCTVTVKASGFSDKVINITQAGNVPTGANYTNLISHQIWGGSGCVYITNLTSNEKIKIYNILGSLIITSGSNSSTSIIPLSVGIYLVKVGNDVQKIIVR